MSTVRDEIVEGMARAFFVTAYADFIERPYDEDEARHVSEEEYEEEREGLPRPGPREDWMDYSPSTSPEAWTLAKKLAKKIESETGKSLEQLYNQADRSCGKKKCGGHDPDLFGHYLAMEAMGSGVSWADDHEDHPFEVPYVEGLYITSRAEALAGEKKRNPKKPTDIRETIKPIRSCREGHTGPAAWEYEKTCPICRVLDAEADEKRRTGRTNPAGLTAKGERMYEHVKSSYAARAAGGAPGLKKNPDPDYKWFVAKHHRGDIPQIFSGWEYESDARDDYRENRDYYTSRSIGNGPVKVISRRTFKIDGFDPDDERFWFVNRRSR